MGARWESQVWSFLADLENFDTQVLSPHHMSQEIPSLLLPCGWALMMLTDLEVEDSTIG